MGLRGGYHVPPTTLTGSVRGDLVFVEALIGVGEVAISDHRSSQPTLDELLRLASECHVAGLMTGKAGILHLHLGDGARGLELVRRALRRANCRRACSTRRTSTGARRCSPRRSNWRARAATIDITAFPVDGGRGCVRAPPRRCERYLASGAPAERVTISSDAGGCLPCFDADGRVCSMDVGASGALLDTLREALARGMALEAALPAFTANPARLLRLAGKGTIAAGADADLVVLDAQAPSRHRRRSRRDPRHRTNVQSTRYVRVRLELHARSQPTNVPKQGCRRRNARLDRSDRRRREQRKRSPASCERFVERFRRRATPTSS